MRISDWSSDVCSSDLQRLRGAGALQTVGDLVRNEGQQLLVAGGVFGAVVIALYGQHAQCAFTADQRHAEPAAGIAWRALQFATGVQLPNMCGRCGVAHIGQRSEEHTSELQSLMRISYAVFCLKKKTN